MSSFPAVVSPAAASREQHASHALPPIPLDVLRRAIPLRSGIGRAHDDGGTESKAAQALYDQGLAFVHAYVWIDAARSFNAALHLDPQLALAHVGLSVALVELNRPADAAQAIAAARALARSAPDHVRRHVDLRALQMAAEEAPGDAARLTAYRAALDAAVAAYPEDLELLLLRGMAESPDPAERGQGSTAASAKYYERALALDPSSFAAHHYLAHACENTGQHAGALTHSRAFAAAAAEVPHARHMLGHNLRRGGRIAEAIAEFEAADRLHRAAQVREKIAAEYDWHVEHNLGLLATSLQHAGRMTRAESLLKAAFDLRTGLLVQAYNKREWPMFLRARKRLPEAEAAARTLIAHPHPVIQATGHIELGLTLLAAGRFADAGAASNAALRLLRTAPGGSVAATALLTLQGEFHLRTAARDKGRAVLGEAVKRLRAAPGPDAWSQAVFSIDAIARAAREIGDWDLAEQMARQVIEHDPAYAGGHYALALALESRGDAAARAAFARALELWSKADPDLPELAAIRRRLK